ncbi:MAG: hypothetical protein H7839_21870 [Magnetococcus sp. YQC-5]
METATKLDIAIAVQKMASTSRQQTVKRVTVASRWQLPLLQTIATEE